MRALRLSLAGTVTLLVLAGPGSATLAQESDEGPLVEGNAWVTGTATCHVTTEWTMTIVDGVEQWRGLVEQCEWVSSDPRITGPVTLHYDSDCYPLDPADTELGCLWWGTFEAPGWVGSLTTTVDASGGFDVHIVQTGRGANAGLTFVGSNTPEGWSGLLYAGDPPPSAPLPSPASE